MNRKLNSFTFLLVLFFPIFKAGDSENLSLVCKSHKILFVGDSITAIKNFRTGAKITSSYPNIVEKELSQNGTEVDVLAKGGETTIWMLKELRVKLQNNSYDRIYFYGGINDAWNKSIKPETTLENVEQIIELIKENGACPYIIVGYEPDGFMDYKKMPVTKYQKSKMDNIQLIEEYKIYQNELINMSKTRGDFYLIDKINMSNKTYDGIHPNVEGQRMIANAVLNTM